MKKSDVPQDKASTHAGHHKLMYAVDDRGNYAGVRSSGWEVESAATRDAIAQINRDRLAAWQRGMAGQTSPLEFHMFNRRMDVPLLAQTAGIFRWRIRRHFRPAVFAQLSDRVLARYCEALGLTRKELQSLPETPPSE